MQVGLSGCVQQSSESGMVPCDLGLAISLTGGTAIKREISKNVGEDMVKYLSKMSGLDREGAGKMGWANQRGSQYHRLW